MPGEMVPASMCDLTKVSISTTGLASRAGLPSAFIDWPEAQTHDIMSFWTPDGVCSESGNTQPYWFLSAWVIFLAASRNSARVDGNLVTPAWAARSKFTKTG